MADRGDVAKKQLRADILTRFSVYLIGMIVALLLGFIAYDTWLANDQRDTILDCTQVHGKCFHRSQVRMQQAVIAVIKGQEASSRVTREVVIYASYCAKLSDNKTVDSVEVCVRDLLKTSHHSK